MLIIVMMGRWSDYSACRVVHDVRLYSVLDTVAISGVDASYSLVLDTLVRVSVFSVIWSDLLITSDISFPLWSSLYECQRVEDVEMFPI